MEERKTKPDESKRQRMRKSIHLLQPGDIIHTYIPFEENTPDYYNGHNPEHIRQPKYTNRRGESGKSRIVIYMGQDKDNLLYLPITSRRGNGADQYHQYELKDNSMINLTGKFPTSYVEVDSLRALKTHPKKSFNYNGKISPLDLDNIMHRVTHTSLQYSSIRDFRGIVPDDMVESWEADLQKEGFEKQDTECGTLMYTKHNVTITRNATSMVHFHRELDREMTHLHVSQREGRMLPPLPQLNEKFVQEVHDLTQNEARQL